VRLQEGARAKVPVLRGRAAPNAALAMVASHPMEAAGALEAISCGAAARRRLRGTGALGRRREQASARGFLQSWCEAASRRH
jgi:hypothetical protein